MRPAGRVDDQHINLAGCSRVQRIVGDRRRIGPVGLGYYRYVEPFSPDLQLLYRCRAEGVTCRQHYRPAGSLEPGGQLGRGGGLTHPVHPHHQDDER